MSGDGEFNEKHEGEGYADEAVKEYVTYLLNNKNIKINSCLCRRR